MFYCLRVFVDGELIGLTWDAIDWKNNQIIITQNTIYVHKKIYTKDPKTETSKRTIDIPSNVIKLLKKHKIQQSIEKMKLGDLWEDNNRILTQWNGKIMHPDSISQWWKKFQRKIGIPEEKVISLHKLRHTFATLLLANKETDIKTVSELLGHSDIGTTNIYVHALETSKRGAAETLQRKLS